MNVIRTEGTQEGQTLIFTGLLPRAQDIVESGTGQDADHVFVTSCSRLGKEALLSCAFNTRFAAVTSVLTGGVVLSQSFPTMSGADV